MDKSLKIVLIISVSIISFSILFIFFIKPIIFHLLLQKCVKKAETQTMSSSFRYDDCIKKRGERWTIECTRESVVPVAPGTIDKAKETCYKLYK